MSNFYESPICASPWYESFFKTEKWNKIWNASNENEFKIEGKDIKQIREEINSHRKNSQRNQRGPN